MKILSLDLGDQWIGSAISDSLGITCRPLKTIKSDELNSFLEKILKEENIKKVVVGLPITIKGKESEQTKKVKTKALELKKQFYIINDKKIEWILWDERLSSKRADHLKKTLKSKKAKQENHSIAAAFILQSYLDSLVFDIK
ncbi:Holliday junction resolvase RuvX [Candidatus Babeliales bacterium]|nr:Holliday junction resolvase RuvX [Candidatus Babeliales bacterium]